jgi:hypothetical protein
VSAILRRAASSLRIVRRADMTFTGPTVGLTTGLIVTVTPLGVFTEIMKFFLSNEIKHRCRHKSSGDVSDIFRKLLNHISILQIIIESEFCEWIMIRQESS